MDDRQIYIHYGDTEFRTPIPVRNCDPSFVKPHGGMWASRTNDEFGWIDWCKREEFRLERLNTCFEFKLKEGSRVLYLKDIDQLDDLPKLPSLFGEYKKGDDYSTCNLDFEKLMEDYDAIELTDVYEFYWALYGWDCNSILIMNPDIVEVIERRDIDETGRSA